LDTNYRSTSEIISSSRAVIVSEKSDISTIFPGTIKEFHSHHGSGTAVQQYRYDTELHELAAIVSDIGEIIKSGIEPQDIAVIVKKNKSLELLAK
jgi:superfamily I DNA/RNA helicase